MLVIRFSRVGRKNKSHFRIVAQEHTMAPSGKHVEILGSYNPHSKEGVFKQKRIEYWVKNGAQISDSVYNLLVRQGTIKGKKRSVKITAKKEKGKKEEGGDKEEKSSETKPEEKEEKAQKNTEDNKKDTEDKVENEGNAKTESKKEK